MPTLPPPDVRLRQAILEGIADERGVHAETAITVAAALAGECALRMAGHPLETIPPGQLIYSQPVNEILFGDAETGWPEHTPWGMLRAALDKLGVDPALMPPVAELAENAASHAYAGPWPYLTVPEENRPHGEPARLAARFRLTLLEMARAESRETPAMMLWSTIACARLLADTAEVLDSRVGVRLALEVMIGMAKIRPLDAPDQKIDDAAIAGKIAAFAPRD